ncbi:MAG: hypothetical protein M1830_000205 [Pleopsidium flavum]|nr:MAG: hypothetical protein M1830_000205 [Pleopsidium flavum]
MGNAWQTNNEGEAELKLKPCIAELLRTDYCQPGLVMLVDKVVVVTMASTEKNQAYRLYLSDGEKNIQAVLKPLMHRFVWTGEIREGSYVMLDNYKVAKGKKLIGDGYVAYLAIADIHTIGRRQRYAQDTTFDNHGLLTELPEEKQPPPKPCLLGSGPITMQDTYAVFKDPAADDNPLGFISRFDADAEDCPSDGSLVQVKSTVKRVDKRKRETMSSPLGELSPNSIPTTKQRRTASSMKFAKGTSEKEASLRKPSSPDNLPENLEFYSGQVIAHHKRCHQAPVVHGSWCNCVVCTNAEPTEGASEEPGPSALAAQKVKPNTSQKSIRQATTSVSQQALRALETRNPLKRVKNPMELYHLSSMTGNRKSQNKRGDYFAVVEWVDDKTIKRFCMSMKRDLRIVDPSAEKKVLLSVFVDPVNFTPAVGTIALFRNLRTHEWDGGSLNAYEKDCAGSDWFIPNPIGIDGCDVEAMHEWWEEREAKEREKRRSEEQVKETMDKKVLAPLCHRGCFRGDDWEEVLELDALGMIAEVEAENDLNL